MTPEEYFLHKFVLSPRPDAYRSNSAGRPAIIMNTAMVRMLTSDVLLERVHARADMRSRLGRD